MSTRTSTSRKSCGTCASASTIESCDSFPIQRLLLETYAITRLLGDAPGLSLGRLAHSGHPTNALAFARTWVSAWVFPRRGRGSSRGHLLESVVDYDVRTIDGDKIGHVVAA